MLSVQITIVCYQKLNLISYSQYFIVASRYCKTSSNHNTAVNLSNLNIVGSFMFFYQQTNNVVHDFFLHIYQQQMYKDDQHHYHWIPHIQPIVSNSMSKCRVHSDLTVMHRAVRHFTLLYQQVEDNCYIYKHFSVKINKKK